MARTARLTIRLEPDEKLKIQEEARKVSRKDSDWARDLLLRACTAPQPMVDDAKVATREGQGVPFARILARAFGVETSTASSILSDLSELGLIRFMPPGRGPVIAVPESPSSDFDLPCLCGHAQGAHEESESQDGARCALCPAGECMHSYEPDTSKREAV